MLISMPQQGENHVGDLLEGFPRAYISQSGSFPHTKQAQGRESTVPCRAYAQVQWQLNGKLPLAATV